MLILLDNNNYYGPVKLRKLVNNFGRKFEGQKGENWIHLLKLVRVLKFIFLRAFSHVIN